MRKLALAFVLLASAAARADEVPNELYERWKDWKVGSSVTFHSDVDTAGVKVEYEATSTLIEITKEKAVVEVTGFTKLGDKRLDAKPKRFEYTATVKKPEPKADSDTASRKEGDEELEVQGKKLKCHWVEQKTDNGTSKTTERSWFSSEVPGGVVRQDVTVDGAAKNTTHSVVTKFEKK
jgi:hypothetical protein